MRIDLKHCILYFVDGASNQIECRLGEGTFSFDQKRNIDYVKNRGLLDTVVEGDQVPLECRLDFIWEHIRSSAGDAASSINDEIPTPYEALTNTGAASTWVSSSVDSCEPYAVNIKLIYTPPCAGDVAETILIQDFRWESLAADSKAGTVNVTGKANIVAPTVTRTGGSATIMGETALDI